MRCAAPWIAGTILLVAVGACAADKPPTSTAPVTSERSSISDAPPFTTATTTAATTTSTGPDPTPTYVFPVQPSDDASYSPFHHDYPAADIFAPCGTPVVATTGGTIAELVSEDVWNSSENDGATRGGLSVTLLGDDGVRYYGSHLAAIDDAVAVGARMEAGQALGTVGDSGNAAGTGCHLHYGISPPCDLGDWEVRRGTVPPARYLDAWRTGDTQLNPVAEVAAWREAHVAVCG